MKFLATLLSVTALLASGISATPLGERGMIEAPAKQLDERTTPAAATNPTTNKGKAPASSSSSKKDYDIDPLIEMWVKSSHSKEMWPSLCNTNGGWEVWAQAELEKVFLNSFDIDENMDIREPAVYEKSLKGGQPLADFILPATDKMNGIIIELKCENKKTNAGDKLGVRVHEDKEKSPKLKAEYEGYTWVALAMAYTSEAQQAITKLGLWAIPDANTKVTAKGAIYTMQAYRQDIKDAAKIPGDMEDLAEAFERLFSTDYESTSSGTTSAAGTPSTKTGSTTTAKEGKTATTGGKKTTAGTTKTDNSKTNKTGKKTGKKTGRKA